MIGAGIGVVLGVTISRDVAVVVGDSVGMRGGGTAVEEEATTPDHLNASMMTARSTGQLEEEELVDPAPSS